MKKVLLMLMMVGVMSLVQADLVIGAGDIWADAAEGNTTFEDGTSPFSATSVTTGLWYQRIDARWGYNDAGQFMVADSDIFQAMSAGYGSAGPCDNLKTTVTGLVNGQKYAVYVVYSTKGGGENWTTTASLDPITLDENGTVTSGLTYGMDAGTYTPDAEVGTTVHIHAGTVIDASTYSGMMGKIGNISSDGSDLVVYIADITDFVVDGTQNYRAWYDGVFLEAVPEPATLSLLGLGALALLRRKK